MDSKLTTTYSAQKQTVTVSVVLNADEYRVLQKALTLFVADEKLEEVTTLKDALVHLCADAGRIHQMDVTIAFLEEEVERLREEAKK